MVVKIKREKQSTSLGKVRLFKKQKKMIEVINKYFNLNDAWKDLANSINGKRLLWLH